MNPADEPPDLPPEEAFARIVRQVAPRAGAALEAEPEPGVWQAARQALQRVAAALSFDSRAVAPGASGLRTRGVQAHHLLFSAKGRDINLRIAAEGATFALRGQVLGPDEGGSVSLATCLRGAERSRPWSAAEVDELGEFHIDALVPGTYELTLRVGSDEIVLPPIDIGDPPRG